MSDLPATIAELRRLLDQVPLLPWQVMHREKFWRVLPYGNTATSYEPAAFDDGSACGEYRQECSDATRDLIVAAINALPALLDALERKAAP